MQSIQGRNPATGEHVEVMVVNGLIQAILPTSSEEEQWLSPGFVDLQINGYCGYDLNAESLTAEVVIALARQLVALGVTTFLPTLITAPEDRILASLRAIAAARGISSLAAHMIPCVHVEGPHISPVDGPRGAHPRAHVRPPDCDELERWQAASGGLVGLITLSPHWDNALDYISRLARRGIVVALGHTDADPDRIHAAAAAGARLSTHLGNGVAGQLQRHPNLLWAQLADDRLTASFIADGHHLPEDTLSAMIRAKGIERSILVSDAVAVGGLRPGVYETAVGGTVELTGEGRIGIPGTGILGGAALPLKNGIANVARLPGFSLQQAIQMATENPGRFVGGRGVVRVGAPADLVQFTWNPADGDLAIGRVFVRGVEQ
ncbi:MAG TPA: amidohydrolase family protein [Terracidiphilus sp.]|nr:amidohydrolase family protein [Terracidiphilus sp.]